MRFSKLIAAVIFALPLGAAAASAPPLIIKVPFTSQAPTFQWSNPRFQDACEETSVLMAMKWVKNEAIGHDAASSREMAREILAISDYESKKYGNYSDTSATTTAAWLIRGYYHYDKYAIKTNAGIPDLIKALEQGSVIIVPTNGRLLHNPNFTGLGPLTHMLLIKGYDYAAKVFIANDPGTRRGESYKYPAATLYNAIADYPTGDHFPRQTVEKTVIIIKK